MIKTRAALLSRDILLEVQLRREVLEMQLLVLVEIKLLENILQEVLEDMEGRH